MRGVSNHKRFLEIMKNPPRKLNYKVEDLILDIYNNNPYILYLRNERVQIKRAKNYAGRSMWHDEPAEIKEFYKLIALEGNRRYKLKNKQLLQERKKKLTPLRPQPQPPPPPQPQPQTQSPQPPPPPTYYPQLQPPPPQPQLPPIQSLYPQLPPIQLLHPQLPSIQSLYPQLPPIQSLYPQLPPIHSPYPRLPPLQSSRPQLPPLQLLQPKPPPYTPHVYYEYFQPQQQQQPPPPPSTTYLKVQPMPLPPPTCQLRDAKQFHQFHSCCARRQNQFRAEPF
ncbi:hypothetical protein RclHR1_04170010 [Rhizophagus clarus]|uniref:A disintegrin and metalloproteinase with thrombospondin motifs 7-like n=1 Tax=Rhizophagus clarus TaxID=94130 RepID=A0A2Z6RSZ8_9GLOM|nr:hypothetical protein RclHR1_04170010 [Rhizophagus clarus]GES76405.1 A disintegrin and metalloproteinase with thrombospondin motifs 7-like [Rhizophagus clarus]